MAKKLILTNEEKSALITDYKRGDSLRSLEKKYHHDRKVLSDILKAENVGIRSNVLNSRKYKHDEAFFEKIDTEEKAYWLGFIYADGFIGSRRGTASQKFGITLKADDAGHLEKFKASIKATNPVLTYRGSGYNQDGLFAKILITSQKTVDDLKDKGVIELKTLVLSYPDEKILPKELERHFVRGYLDGDGCISYHGLSNDKRAYALGFTGTRNILEGIKKFFGKEEVKISPHNNAYQINICGNIQTGKMLDILYSDATIYLDRKFDIYKEYLKYAERQG